MSRDSIPREVCVLTRSNGNNAQLHTVLEQGGRNHSRGDVGTCGPVPSHYRDSRQMR